MGLLRTAARASVAASVVGNVQRRQHRRWSAQDAAANAHAAAPVAPQAPAAGTDSVIEQLTKLAELRTAGVLTDAEFDAQKQRVLGA